MDDSDIYDHSSTLRAALRAGLRRAAEVTACSAFTLSDAEERFELPPGRGQVVFNGVDTDLEAPAVPAAWSTRGPFEAWRAGTPVIASSVGGAPEFVEDGRLGLVVDPHDTAALAGALVRVLADPVLRDELGQAGKRAVADSSWARIAATCREVYGRAVSARR